MKGNFRGKKEGLIKWKKVEGGGQRKREARAMVRGKEEESRWMEWGRGSKREK